MPVQYAGIIAEHRAVRSHAGLFDVSHMGQLELSGSHAATAVARLTCGSAAELEPGRAQYCMLLAADGGTIDDIIVYRLGAERFLIVVNAANAEGDWQHVRANLTSAQRAGAADRSDDYALLALQGPAAQALLQPLCSTELQTVAGYAVIATAVAGRDVLLARTGYTGEDGFELFVASADAEALWQALLDSGGDELQPAGLGARDTLRLEASLPLYGHELDRDTSPLQAGLGRFVAERDDYIGAEAIARLRTGTIEQRLIMLRLTGRAVAREGHAVYTAADSGAGGAAAVGNVTSGSDAPTLDCPVAMAYVERSSLRTGDTAYIDIRGRREPATVVKRPFYKRQRAADNSTS